MQRRIRYFEMQCERHPDARHYLALADLYRRDGDPARALDVLNDGLSRGGESLSGRYLLGLTHLDLGAASEAASQFARVLDGDPDHALAAEALARCREETPGAPAPEPDFEEAPPPAVSEAETSEEGPVSEAEVAPEDDAPPAPAASASKEAPLTAAADTRRADPVPSMFVTRTLSDIYLSQGHKDKALRILHRILATHPDREDIVARIAELEGGDDAARKPDHVQDVSAVSEADNRQRFDAWVDRSRGEA